LREPAGARADRRRERVRADAPVVEQELARVERFDGRAADERERACRVEDAKDSS
jgi:hypothetical protein